MVIVRHGSMNIFIRRSGQVQAGVMKSVVIKRSILINGRKTSVSLENEFWDALHEIAEHENVAISALVEKINEGRNNINLSSAIRVFVFNHYRPINGKEAEPPFRTTQLAGASRRMSRVGCGFERRGSARSYAQGRCRL
jgi:predicted DNA-binding ribbon-helix-helix protein